MRTRKLSTKTITVSLLAIAMLSITGMIACNKNDKAITPTAEAEKVNITNLVASMHKSTNDKEAQAITKEYEALSAEELEQFWMAKNERDIKTFEAMQAAGSTDLNESTKYIIKKQGEAVVEFRMSLLRLSQEKLGISLNKIKPEQFDALASEILKDQKYSILKVEITPAAKASSDVGALACTQINYPQLATEVNFSGGTGYYATYRYDNAPDVTPCDFEHRFNGTFYYIRGERLIDQLAIATNPLKRYLSFSDGQDTAILVGYGAWLANVFPTNLQARML